MSHRACLSCLEVSALSFIGMAALACSAGNTDAGGGETSTSSGGGQGAGVTTSSSFNTGGGVPTETGCSPDLKSVVDAMGNVIETCPPDQGCAGGMCVPACDAAAAAKGSIGCDWTIATPSFYVGIAPPCFAAFVTNNWDKPIVINVSRGGTNYDATSFGRIAQSDPNVAGWPTIPASGLPSGEVAVLFLSDDPTSFNGGPLTCPIEPAIRGPLGTAVQGTGLGQAWHIHTDAPGTMYDILPYGGALSYLPSAELLQPVTAWGTNYVSVLPPPSSGPPWGQIVANEDGTTITILPNVALPSGAGVSPYSANVQSTLTLNAGEYVQWEGPEMTGTIVQSDKPVAFTGGDGYQCYTSATSGGGGCDSGHQQIPAISAQSNQYIGMAFQSRLGSPESIPYRIVGAVDGTTLSYDPPVPSAPTSLSLGQSVQFESTTSFKVTSQDADHPFYLGQVMPGAGCVGDEDFVNMLPPAQWLAKYVFFTDPTYPTTNLVFVRERTRSGFADVSLECLGTISGWQPIGSSGEYEIATVDLIRDSLPNGGCTNGPQVADSTAPFGLQVWGLSSCSSYSYPAGGNASTINTVVVPPVPR
jgi:hypothetical protein